MTDLRKIKRALISVSDKTGVAEFAAELSEFGVEIISTGGTAKVLRDAGLTVTDVSDVTGFPEMMDGRVKTLHPKIHGAFLALRDNRQHMAALDRHGIQPIDLVVINLYPFEKTVEKEGVKLEEAVENIDIGGPAMIRSASKNWSDVAVVTDPELYHGIIEEMKTTGGFLLLRTRQRLAVLAYTRTASYDLAISSHFARQLSEEDREFLEPLNPLKNLVFIESGDLSEPEAGGLMSFAESSSGNPVVTASGSDLPARISLTLAKVSDLRYGENPHQKAALYDGGETGGIANAKQLHGKEMSFNNYVDAEAAWRLVQDFDELAVAIIKHTNPSGVGLGHTNEEAYRRALATDPVSAFGGIVAFNRKVDAAVAASVNQVFTEVVLAPDFKDQALEIFRRKKNLRVLKVSPSSPHEEGAVVDSAGGVVLSGERPVPLTLRQISGGMLVQQTDTHGLAESDLKVVTEKEPSPGEIRALLFAWTVCKHVKSNAIVLANENRTIGVGAGQMNRVDSLRIAVTRAERFGSTIKGSVLASDAFFPFRDNVDESAKKGVSAIIQPGGSIKDEESIQAANEHGISMVFTGIRHFNH